MNRCVSLLGASVTIAASTVAATALAAPSTGPHPATAAPTERAATPGAPTAAPTASQAALPTLRLDGVGPLRLGMRLRGALGTGWLARRARGCELAGPPLPITYQLAGARAPAVVRGVAIFDGGSKRLTNLVFMSGVRTATGVVAGQTTATGMVHRYGGPAFAARSAFDRVFGGTFATVERSGRQAIMGFARGRPSARRPVTSLGIPIVPLCE